MSISLAFSTALAAVMVTALLLRRSNRVANLILALTIMLGLGRQLVMYKFPSIYMATAFDFFIAPLLIFYISAFVGDSKKLPKSYLLVISLCLLIGFTTFLFSWKYLQNSFALPLLFSIGVELPLALVAQKILNRFRHQAEETHSDLGKIHLSWLKIIVNICFVMLVVDLADLFTGPSIPLWKLSPFFLLSFLFILSVFSLFHSRAFAEMKNHAVNKGESLSATEIEKFRIQLIKYFEEKKPFLNTQFTLAELSEGLGLKPYKTSALINNAFNMNFFNLVNKWRVEHAKKLLVNPANGHFNLLGIAEESGFNSKSVFNDAFKKFTSLTPTQYKSRKMRELQK